MIAKALEVLAVQVFYAMTFALAAQEKWAGPLPDWFVAQFGGTWMARAPGGLSAAYFGIAAAETLAAFAFIMSLLRLEPVRADRPVLRAALILSVFLFAGLAYGQRLTAKYDSAAVLFVYFAGTFLILRAVEARA